MSLIDTLHDPSISADDMLMPRPTAPFRPSRTASSNSVCLAVTTEHFGPSYIRWSAIGSTRYAKNLRIRTHRAESSKIHARVESVQGFESITAK